MGSTMCVKDIDGYDDITSKDQHHVQSILTDITQKAKKQKDESKNREEKCLKKEKEEEDNNLFECAGRLEIERTRMNIGKKKVSSNREVGPKINVKFGAHICYGELLPQRETSSHCY